MYITFIALKIYHPCFLLFYRQIFRNCLHWTLFYLGNEHKYFKMTHTVTSVKPRFHQLFCEISHFKYLFTFLKGYNKCSNEDNNILVIGLILPLHRRVYSAFRVSVEKPSQVTRAGFKPTTSCLLVQTS